MRSVCELVTIGEDCFIGHGVVFVNDNFSAGRPAGAKNCGAPPQSEIAYQPDRARRFFL
jgi:hypothetical protein